MRLYSVHWDKTNKKYRAMITFKGNRYDLGRNSDMEKAKETRQAVQEKVFDEFLSWYYAEFRDGGNLQAVEYVKRQENK